jgi:uncharacterized membrane protein
MALLSQLNQFSPVLPWHVGSALGALLLGPVALTARKGSPLHRTAGYVWVGLMLSAALTSAFLRDHRLPNLFGYTPIHLLTVYTLVGIPLAVWAATRHNVAAHRNGMRRAYFGGCVLAGLFTLLPGRLLGAWLWHDTLGWV